MTSFMTQEEMTKAIMKLKIKTKENATALKDIYPKLVMIQSEMLQAEKRNQTLVDKINEMNSLENKNKNKTNEESLQQHIYKCTMESNSFKEHLTQQREILMELEMKYFTDFKTLKEMLLEQDILKEQKKEHECKIDELQRQMSDNFLNIQQEQMKNFDQINDLKSKIKEQNEMLKQHKSENGIKLDDIRKRMSNEVLELKEQLKQLNEINNMKSQTWDEEKTFNANLGSETKFDESQRQMSNKLLELQQQFKNFTSQVTNQTMTFNHQQKHVDNEMLYIKMQIFNIVNGISIKKGTTALHLACEYGLTEIALALKYDEISVNAVNKEGMTPLHLACKFGLNDVAIKLIYHGANVNISNPDGMTPLHFICKNDLLEANKPLTLGMFSIKYKNNKNHLHFSIKNSHDVSVIHKLLNQGANVNCKNNAGWTPLHFAAHSGYDIIVEELIKFQADVHYKTDKGVIPLHLAAVKGFMDSEMELSDNEDMSLIKEYEYTLINFYSFSDRGYLSAITNLLLHGSYINCKDNDRNTPLHCAVIVGFLPAVIKLLDSGANVNDYDQSRGGSPLHSAIKFGYINIVTELLNRGSLINCRDMNGNAPLHLAAGNGHVSMLTLLLNYGADIKCKNNKMKTALDLAIEKNRIEAIKILKYQVTL